MSFKKAVPHIVCMNKDDCLEVQEIERFSAFLGVALSSGIGDFTLLHSNISWCFLV